MPRIISTSPEWLRTTNGHNTEPAFSFEVNVAQGRPFPLLMICYFPGGNVSDLLSREETEQLHAWLGQRLEEKSS